MHKFVGVPLAPGSMAACAGFFLAFLWIWDGRREGMEALFKRLSLADHGT